MQNKIIKIVAIKILLALSIFLNVMIADVIEVISVGTKLSHNEQTFDQTEQKTEINKVNKDKNSNKSNKSKKDNKDENVKKKEEIEKVTETKTEKTNIAQKENVEKTEKRYSNTKEQNKLVSLGTFKLTAYCPCTKCCGKNDGITASGTVATQGRTVACNSLPAGTEVIINEKRYIVEDTGNMGDEVIDIFFNNHQDALDFGVQHKEVFIYDN